MARGLLLGNGINSRLCIGDLSVKNIADRFKKNVLVYSIIINNIFGVQIEEDFLNYSEMPISELGIETLAGVLYKYIKENKNQSWTDNDEYRLQDLITCICITSIFYDKKGKIGQVYDKSKMPFVENYDYIFTLNYFEFWDKEQRCVHLHGKVDLSKLDNVNNAILVSSGRMNLAEYARAVDYMKKTNNVIEFYPNDLVFSPSAVKKDKLICVTGVYPSDKLYPADDLFLYRPKELYVDLDSVDELDVFGMSPFGDESIIEKINEKKLVRVFVYNKDENEETKAWKSKLKCNYELLDSSDLK